MSIISALAVSCLPTQQSVSQEDDFQWVVDKFDEFKILRFRVDGFSNLSLKEKELIYYLSQAALSGRDIIYDQNSKYNLLVRRTLETIYVNYKGDRKDAQWGEFEKYLKKVWFANGIHHHYSSDKFTPGFSADYFNTIAESIPSEKYPQDYGTAADNLAFVAKVIFDPALYPVKVSQKASGDLLKSSAMNYYEGVTQREAEMFYANMANPKDKRPISYGLNSKLVKERGKLKERTWKIGGMYSQAIERIVYWLEKAAEVANGQQRKHIEKLISYYKSGDLREFDEFNILWVQDTLSRVDFVNGFTEIYGDPLGYKAAWESIVNIKDSAATRRTEIISENAQWFENNAPILKKYKKKKVKGISAKVINIAMLGGDSYPSTPKGVNLPNADWIRKDYGSKSVTIQNVNQAYAESEKGDGFLDEFVLRPTDRERITIYKTMADNLHTDLHECLGHGSGQLAPGVKGDELKQYGSVLEEARADLFGLYYSADPKMIELGLVPNKEVYKAQYSNYIMNGMMTQLVRIELGKTVEQTHMRNRQLIANWAYEHGRKDKVIEKVVEDGKTYIVVNNFEKLRRLFSELLGEIQRIKSEGDFAAGKALVEKYGVKIDRKLHEEVLTRYAGLNAQPYSGFINPVYRPVMENGEIIDIMIEYPGNYTQQMLEYSSRFSFLPTIN